MGMVLKIKLIKIPIVLHRMMIHIHYARVREINNASIVVFMRIMQEIAHLKIR